jgi:hypothetical protein
MFNLMEFTKGRRMIFDGIRWRAHSGAPLHFLLFLTFCSLPLFAAAPDAPVFVAQVPNPNDYALFANNGWDGNWYVGYNNGWIKKLPAIPKGNYVRAYVGAKLGRMKTLPPVGRPPRFNPVPGEIWMAISSTPAWTPSQRFKLTTTEDIPLDGNSEYALENTGESQWFWAEVPLEAIDFSGDNFLALWSPTPELVSVSSAPVLAAAWGGKDVNTWLAKDIRGEPPKDAKTALSTGISYFQPALALKLIFAANPHPMQARIISWQNGTPDHLKPVIAASVEGESVERVWVEYDASVRHGDGIKGHWAPLGRPLWKAPFTFSLDQEKLLKGKVLLRIAAVNIWEEKAASSPFEIEVNPIHEQK